MNFSEIWEKAGGAYALVCSFLYKKSLSGGLSDGELGKLQIRMDAHLFLNAYDCHVISFEAFRCSRRFLGSVLHTAFFAFCIICEAASARDDET